MRILVILFLIISTNIYAQTKTVKHVVKQKETLYSLARTYGVSIAEIGRKDPKSDLEVGEILTIPQSVKKVTTTDIVKKESVLSSQKNRKTHLVVQGETLFSIARKYRVTTAKLKEWNKLKTLNVNIGQEIIVSQQEPDKEEVVIKAKVPVIIREKPEKKITAPTTVVPDSTTHLVKKGETMYSISKKYGLKATQLMQLNHLNSTDLSVGKMLKVVDESKEIKMPLATDKPTVQKKKKVYYPVSIRLVVTQNSSPALNKPYSLGLHQTISVGTIVKVEAKNETAYVRIVGKTNTADLQRLVVNKHVFSRLKGEEGESLSVSAFYVK
ncbi:MAG: LysM peptidoglycan-binding domain-containing protein [Cyclobacteriaceae bacterium]